MFGLEAQLVLELGVFGLESQLVLELGVQPELELEAQPVAVEPAG